MNSRYVITAAVCFVVVVVFAAHSYQNAVVSAGDPGFVTKYGHEQAFGPVRNIRFTVLGEGIRPHEIRIKAGLVNLTFEDKTNIAHGVTVQRRTGTDLVDLGMVQKGNNQARGRNLFRLTPGEYEVLNSSQPAQKAIIIVEP